MKLEIFNERREDFKKEMREFFSHIGWPITNMVKISDEIHSQFSKWGIFYIGMNEFGPALQFGGEWWEEGVSVEVMVVGDKINFRWR